LSQLLNPVRQRPARLNGADDWPVSIASEFEFKHLRCRPLQCRMSDLWQSTSQLVYQSQSTRKKLFLFFNYGYLETQKERQTGKWKNHVFA